MNGRDHRRPHANHAGDRHMKVRRPRLDRSRQCIALPHQGRQISADAEQPAARGDQNRTHVVPLAELGHADVEFAAEITVDRISTIGSIQHDMGKTVINGAIKRFSRRREVH